MTEAPQTVTKSQVSLRHKVAVGLAILGVLSGLAASVVAATSGTDPESARTLIWVLLAGTGLAPVALIIGRVG